MNDLVRFASSVEFATGKKRGRHPVFSARMFYPYAAERRLQIALRNELEEYIGAAYEAAVFNESFSKDSLAELSLLQEGVSDDLKAEISYAAESIARKVSSSIAEMTEMTVGKPYYPQAAKESLLKDWEANFQMLCVSAESDAKKDIARLVTQAKNEGWNGKQLEKAVKKELPEKYANRASLIARTETAKLNTSITLETYKEIGCQYYMWMATLDERVRQDHAAMNGRICSVADPTVYFEENPDDPMHPVEKQRVEGEMCMLHPGDDFQCRCTMVMWDPVIDGKYEVKEAPEEEEPKEPEKKPESDPKSEELEKAKEETDKANERAEKAEQKLNEEQRRREILQNANERHAKRTVADREKIQAKWTVSHPHSQMPDKFKTVDDIAAFWNKIDKSRDVLGQERILKNGEFRYDGVDRKNNGSTMMDGSIKLNSKIGKDCVSAFEKIRLRESLTEDEATSMATLWHEMTHNRHKRTSWIELATNAKETKYMEMANELVARNTLGEFYRMLGLKENPFKSLEKFRSNTSYNPWVVGLQSASEMFGIDRKVFVDGVADSLFNKAYNNQRISLSQVLLNNVKDLKENEAKKIVDYCIGIRNYKFENGLFITRDYVDIGTEIYNNVIASIQEAIKKRKKKK